MILAFPNCKEHSSALTQLTDALFCNIPLGHPVTKRPLTQVLESKKPLSLAVSQERKVTMGIWSIHVLPPLFDLRSLQEYEKNGWRCQKKDRNGGPSICIFTFLKVQYFTCCLAWTIPSLPGPTQFTRSLSVLKPLWNKTTKKTVHLFCTNYFKQKIITAHFFNDIALLYQWCWYLTRHI